MFAMFSKHGSWVLLCAIGVTGVACQQRKEKIETGIQAADARMDAAREDKHVFLAQMVDNAMLYDMTVADSHFVAHTAELSGLGAERLDRMAPLLTTYGGTVRYETYSTDKALIDQRLAHVREYLSVIGCDMDRVTVQTMISGGRHVPADQAIKAMENELNQGQGASSNPSSAGFGLPSSNN